MISVIKTIQVIGVLFRSDNVGRMNYMRLLKLLYIVDREALREQGRQVVGGPAVSMRRGPVLEEVYDLIRGQHREMPLWASYFHRDRFDLEMVKTPDVGKLSKYEISKIQEVADRYSDKDEWDMVQITHSFEEWADPGDSFKRIDIADILKAVGVADRTEEILEEMEEAETMKRLFGGS